MSWRKARRQITSKGCSYSWVYDRNDAYCGKKGEAGHSAVGCSPREAPSVAPTAPSIYLMLPGSGGDTCQRLSLLGPPAGCLRGLPQKVCTGCLQTLGVTVLFSAVICSCSISLPGVDYWELQLVVSMRPLWSVSAGCSEHQRPLAVVPTHLSLVIYSLTVCSLRA